MTYIAVEVMFSCRLVRQRVCIIVPNADGIVTATRDE